MRFCPSFWSILPSKTYSAHYGELVYIKPGETKRLCLKLESLSGDSPPPNKKFIFGTSQAEAAEMGENVLYVWLDGKVKVTWEMLLLLVSPFSLTIYVDDGLQDCIYDSL